MNNSTRSLLNKSTQFVISCAAFFLTAVIFLVFIVPLIAAFIPSFVHNETNAGAKAADFFYIFKVALWTLKIAILSTLVAFVIGFPAAFFCAKRNFVFRKVLLGMSAVPLCIPILIAALGFVSVFGMSGIMNNLYAHFSGGQKGRFLYSQSGLIIAQGFYNFPIIMSMVSKAWENLPSENENAARLLGAGEGRVFFTVTLPALGPSIVSGIIPVFLFSFFSFMMVLLFSAPGTTTLEVEIYQAFKNSLDMTLASRFAIIETITALLVVAFYSLLVSSKSLQGQVFEKKERSAIGKGNFETKGMTALEIFLAIIVFFLIFIFFVFPLLGIFFSGLTARVQGKNVFSFSQYLFLFKSKSFWQAFRTTLVVSFWTGFICVVLGFVYALSLHNIRNLRTRKVYEILALLPMAVSSVVLGFGITLIVHRGNGVYLVLVQSALFWPLAFRQISASLDKIPHDVSDAVLIMSGNRKDGVFRVFIPWVKKSLFSAFGFCFAFSAGDTTLPLVLSIPKFSTLSLYTYRLSGSYRFNTACASGTILALLCFFVFSVAGYIGEEK